MGMTKSEEKTEEKKDKKEKEEDENKEELVKDEYAQLVPDMLSTAQRGKVSFQEKTLGRELNRTHLYFSTKYGTLVETNAKGVPVVMSTGTEVDAQGNMKVQRFHIGQRAEANTKDRSVKTVNLAGNDTLVQDFKVISSSFPLLEQTIEDAKKKGEAVQKKIDEENEEYWEPFYEEPIEFSANYDAQTDVDLNLMKELVAQARQVLKRELGSKFDTAEIRLIKLTETSQFAASDGSKYDVVLPRIRFSILAKSKMGNQAFRSISGCGGTLEEILKRDYPDKALLEIATHIATKVANELQDIDRAQDAIQALGGGEDVPVILSSSVAGVLAHEMMGHCTEGDIILENKRTKDADVNLKARIGGQISENPNFTMIDDGSIHVTAGDKELRFCWAQYR